MYYILDANEKIVGMLANEGTGCPFYDDIHENIIAESNSSDSGQLNKIWSETLTLTVPYGYTETELLDRGSMLLFQDASKHWKLFTVYEIEDSIKGQTHIKKVQAFNSAIWRLAHLQLPEKHFTNATAKAVFLYIFQRSGWALENIDSLNVGDIADYTIAEGNAQSALDQALKDFNVEIEGYAVIEKGNIINKYISITNTIGEETGVRFEYRNNIVGASRKKVESDFYTRLYVYGGTDEAGKRTSISNANKVLDPVTGQYQYWPYLENNKSNDDYNFGRDHLEGVIVNDKLLNSKALRDWGTEQFKYYDHPKHEYNVDVALLGAEVALGDKVAVVDLEMLPAMTITARVVKTSRSLSTPTANTATLGEFTTIRVVTPALIWQLQSQANQGLQAIEESQGWSVLLNTVDGITDRPTNANGTTTLFAKVFKGDRDMTTKFHREAFNWYCYNLNGTLNIEETQKLKKDSNYIPVRFGFKYVCEVMDTDINIASEPYMYTKEEDFRFMAKLQNEANAGVADWNYSLAQNVAVDAQKGHIYWSQQYRGTATPTNIGSYSLTRTDMNGKYIDRMIIIGGGLGHQFGLRVLTNKTEIYSHHKDTTANKSYLVRYAYQPNKTLKFIETEVLASVDGNREARWNYDAKNDKMLCSFGLSDKTEFYVFDGTAIRNNRGADIKKSSELIENVVTGREFGINPGKIFQCAYLDFPYMYATYGYETPEEKPFTVCVNVITKELVHKLDYAFTDDIKVPNVDGKAYLVTPQACHVYYEGDERWIIQGFGFRHEDPSINLINNMIYRTKERRKSI